jgi:hypothetical protein
MKFRQTTEFTKSRIDEFNSRSKCPRAAGLVQLQILQLNASSERRMVPVSPAADRAARQGKKAR